MSSIVEMLIQQVGGAEQVSQMSKHLGVDTRATQQAVGAALPVLLGALARNAAKSDGAAALNRALDRHDGTVLDNLGAFLQSPDVADGEGILRHALGERRPAVEAGVSKASGLDPSVVGKLLPMLAPLVMGALGRQRRQQSLDTGGLASMLSTERQQMEQANPAIGMLGKLLDQDGDGSIVDDIAGKLGKGLLGGLFGGRN